MPRFLGVPCIHGHTGWRYVASRNCVDCHKQRRKAYLKRRGYSQNPTYNTWRGMRQRCENSKHTAYGYYGGRGIKVCERWILFSRFVEDMGERPTGTTLDRIDVNGDYEPGNCRWATPEEQSRNTRDKLCVNCRNKIVEV